MNDDSAKHSWGADLPAPWPLRRLVMLLLLCLCLPPTARAAQSVRVGIYQNEPKIFLDEQGEPAGFFVDVLDAIARDAGWQLQYVPCVWHHCLQMLEQGELDIMPDVAQLPERSQRFDFGHEVVLSSWSVLYKHSGSPIDTILDLDNRQVAVLRNSIQYSAMRQRCAEFDVHPHFVQVDSFRTAFELLQQGEVQAVLANRFYGAQHMATYGAEESHILVRPSSLKLAFTKGADNPLLKTSDEQLRRLKADKNSIYYQSQQRWLSPLDKSLIPPWTKWAVLAAGLMLLMLLTLVVVLRYLVKQRTAQLTREKQHYYHLSRHDPLTGLPNRLMFVECLRRAMRDPGRRNGKLHVFFMNINQFKHINDSVGHAVGDDILQAVATRLAESLQTLGTLARLGGDEFALISGRCKDAAEAGTLAKRLTGILDAPLFVAGHEFYLSMSIGISRYPQDGGNSHEILKNADTALTHAKKKGRNKFEFYSAEMSEQALRRVTLEAEFKAALSGGQLRVYYQPQVALVSGEMVGVEALVRWQHPHKGLISPNDFIPMAEDTGMISELGELVMHCACAQMAAWRAAGLPLRQIAINVSPRQFHDDTFLSRVRRIIAATGCRPEWVTLEITETAVMGGGSDNIEILSQLRAIGFTVAIDDFGTGHSSLSRLKRLPVSKLKIDLSFVQCLLEDSSCDAIVRAVIALGHGLGLSVVAEGIETEAQRSFLLGEACDEGQGFLFARALEGKQITALLQTGRDKAQDRA